MQDMLVRLYDIPDHSQDLKIAKAKGIEIRRALSIEKHVVVQWVREKFKSPWASECEIAFSNKPISCFIALENNKIVGFACYEVTCKNFFGPVGVDESVRGKGVGKLLLLSCLHTMREQGYAYAIIGGVGPVDFYAKTVGAVVIEGSNPGIFRGMIWKE